MKTQLKYLSVLAAALAVVFSTAGVSMAFNAPGEMANCREIDSGLSFECDPVSNLAVVNSSVIPVTGFGLASFSTSLRSINDLAFGLDDLALSDFALTLPVVPVLGLSDFAISSSGLENLSLSDFAISAIGLDSISLSDFAITVQDSLIQEDNLFLMDDFYSGGQYGSGY